MTPGNQQRGADPPPDPLADALAGLGRELRKARRAGGLTQKMLAERAEISVRFLAQVESGGANISVARLLKLCQALELSPPRLFAAALPPAVPAERKIALLGMRGAGKSAVGGRLAELLGVPLVELDREIEAAAGMSLGALFELTEGAQYRVLERRCLEAVLERPGRLVLATGGSIVTDPTTFDLLRARTHTLWLRAAAAELWSRVLAQGDTRPMADHPDAMARLRMLLAEREPLYRQASRVVETAARDPEQIAEELVRELGDPR